MKKYLISISLIFLLTTGFTGCFFEKDNKKQVTDAIQVVVDTHFNAATVKSGISVALYKDGYTWTYAAGKAAEGVAMTTATPGYAYSITKTIVSALVLTQIEEGEYNLNSTVEELLSNNSDYLELSTDQKAFLNTTATVAQLLSHTSGMPDYASNVSPILGLCDPSGTWKPVDILKKIVNQPYVNDGAFRYSNTNYILLGMIAEHKGSAKLNTLLSQTFFTPLGLSIMLAPQDFGSQDSTTENVEKIPANIAKPYDDAAMFGVHPPDSYLYLSDAISSIFVGLGYNFFLGAGRATWAAGGIIATAENLAKWGYELYDADGDAVTSAVRTTLKNSIPTTGNYGYGLSYNDFTYNDGTIGGKYGHGGSAVGYKTLLRYEAANRIAVVIMTNANNIPDSATTQVDTELGLVDREALVNALLNAYNDNY